MENDEEATSAHSNDSEKSPAKDSTNFSFWRSIFNNSNQSNSSVRRGNRVKEGNEAEITIALSIPHLSPLAHSVISRCSKILQMSAEELQHCFDAELPNKIRQPSNYARNFLEFCSYQAIHLSSMLPDYLSDKNFRRLMFDMMLAWESSGVENDLRVNVDNKRTVGLEAFARIAPSCSIVADIITVHNLFDALTSSSGHRLHFLIFDKYLRSLEKVIKAVNNGLGPQFASNLSLAEEEIILDIDGAVPTHPVLQHVGISAWPGRLTLTNYALYFESGVGLYDKAVRYDLATETKQVLRPELTGPLGARLFDKAVMYKSISIAEPVYFEFPEFKGSSRRDYWLDICLEILRAHRFIRKYNLKEYQLHEALARAILGIFRCRAIREALHLFSSNYKTLLCFNLAESLPGGDVILEALFSRLSLLSLSTVKHDSLGSPNAKKQPTFPISLLTLRKLGIITCKEVDFDGELTFQIGEICVGDVNPLEAAVKQSKQDTGRAEAAQATVDQVKVEGIDTNLAVMKELLGPLITLYDQLQLLVSWEKPWKSMLFLVIISCTILSGWIRHIFPCFFIFLAISMLWRRHTIKGRPLEAFKIKAPPGKNAVEQLLTLQEAVTHVEGLIQSANIVLLKLRALIFAVVPQATEKVTLLLILIAAAFAFVPLKYVLVFVFAESFTRRMPVRRESSDRWLRRTREWWIRIPAAPVQLIKADDKKRK